jgi:Lrp/AsnC family leucine-responsive transcriptional regulator
MTLWNGGKPMAAKKVDLDSTDWKILACLHRNARATFQEIGSVVAMTRPAVRERVLRMEEAGLIEGYRAEINTDALGRSVHVMIHFKFNSDRVYPGKPNDVLIGFLDSSPSVVRYWEIYGELDFLIEASFDSKTNLHRFLDDLRTYGFVRSHLIASTYHGHFLELDEREISYNGKTGEFSKK